MQDWLLSWHNEQNYSSAEDILGKESVTKQDGAQFSDNRVVMHISNIYTGAILFLFKNVIMNVFR